MEKQKSNSSINILVFINSSYGEIDWILPVCSYIKRNFPNVRIYAFFNSFDSDEIMKGNTFLYDLFVRNVDEIYQFKDFTSSFISTFVELSKNILNHQKCPILIKRVVGRSIKYFIDLLKNIHYKKIVHITKPDILLKDTSNDTGVRRKIVEIVKENGGRDIMFHHASNLLFFKPPNKWKNKFADDILCNTKSMADHFSDGNEISKNKKHIVGIPRYDKWWIKYLTKEGKDFSHERYNLLSDKTVFLVYTYGGRSKHKEYPFGFSKEAAVKRLIDIIEVLSSFDNSLIILKPHPRQDTEKLKNIIKKHDYKNCIIDHSHPICLSSIADAIIAMNDSSTILDSLSVEKVTIRFLKNKERRSGGEIEKFDLSPFATNRKELKNLVEKNLDNKNNFTLKYVKNFNKIISSTKEGATKKAIEVILQDV